MQHTKSGQKEEREKPIYLTYFLVLGFIIIFFGFGVASVSGTIAFTVSNVSTGTGDTHQQSPAIWQDRIVWQDRFNWNDEIVLYNCTSGEERSLTKGGGDETQPDIFENLVVWVENVENNYSVVLYDLNRDEIIWITHDPSGQSNPSIWGDLIVWEDQRGEFPAIFYYDLAIGEAHQASENTSTSRNPDVWGNYIVWEQWIEDNSEIMLFNISNNTPSRITFDSDNQQYPSIWEDRIVWTEYRDGYRQLSLFNITTGIETNLTSDPWHHGIPVIYGDIIVFENERDYFDVSLINITSNEEILLTPDTPDTAQTQPAIWDDRIVWKDDQNQGYLDIYLCTLGIPLPTLTADFMTNITEGMPPLAVEFTETSIGNVVSWWWDFGDGTDSHEQNPVHTYNDPEIYSVILTVQNPWQRSAVKMEGLITVGMAPRPDFTADVYSGPVPLEVQFLDTSTGYPESWLWEFGDGDTDSGQNPLHVYDIPGSYTVTLTAENKWGNGTTEKESCIVVMDADTHEVILPVEGVMLDDSDFILNTSLFKATIFDPLINHSVITCIPDYDSGISALRFLTDDPEGFSASGNETIEGTLSGIIVTSLDFQSENRNTTQGLVWTYNYSAFFPQYPEYGKITSQVWEGSTPDDRVLFEGIARENHYHVKDTAYTIQFQQENISSSGPSTLIFGIDADWIEEHGWRRCLEIEGNVEQCMVFVDSQYVGDTPICLDGGFSPGNHTMMVSKYGFENNITTISFQDKRDYIRLVRVSDWGEGSLVDTRFVYHDSVTNMDYFQAYAPEGFSKFGIVSVWQEGNVFQIITLIVAKVVGQSSSHSSPFPSHSPSGNTATQEITSVPTPRQTQPGTGTESPDHFSPLPTALPTLKEEPEEPAPLPTSDGQGTPSPSPPQWLPQTLKILENLSIIFVFIFVTVLFYLRWRRREE